MSTILSTVSTGKKPVPVFCLIHGVDGIGKTTFASQAPNPIFLGIETGTMQLDVSRLPAPYNYAEFIQQVHALRLEKHEYRTLVIDSLDWLEPLIWSQICAEANVDSVEKYQGGYGKGYTRALDFWREIIRALTILQRRMHIILIAHTLVRKFEDPEQLAAYDRYQIALNEKAAMLIRQAVDCVLFCNYKVKVVNIREGSQGAKGKGKGTAERVMYSETRPAFDAKNRFNLPFEMPLNWKVLGEHIKAFYAQGAVPKQAPVSSSPATAEPPKPMEAAKPDNGEKPKEEPPAVSTAPAAEVKS